MLSRIFKRSRALLPRRAGASPRRWNNPLGGRMNNTRKADPGGLYSRRGWSFIFRRRPTRMLFGSSGGFPAHVPRVFSSGQVRRAIVGRRSFTGDAERTGWKTSAAWKSFSCLGTRPPRALSPEKRPNDSLSLSLSLSLSKKLDFPREIIRNMNRPFFLETDRRPGAECHWETYSQRFPEFRRSELWKFRNSKRTGKSRRWSISTKIDFWLESSKRFLDGNFDTHPAKISYSLGVLIQWIFHVPRHTLDLKLAIELSQKCLVVYFFFSITSPLAFKKNTQTKLCILNWYSHRTAKTYKSARQTEIKIDRFPLSRRVSCG